MFLYEGGVKINKTAIRFKEIYAVYVVVVIILIYIVFTLIMTNLRVIIVDSTIKEQNAHHVTRWADTYFYYTSDEGIYRVDKGKEPQLILKIAGVIAMTCNNNYLFIVKKDQLIKVTYNGVEIARATNEMGNNIGLSADKENLLITNDTLIKAVDIDSLNLKHPDRNIKQETYMSEKNIYGNRIFYSVQDNFLYRNLKNTYYVRIGIPIEIEKITENKCREKLLKLPRDVYVKENNIAINNNRILVVGQNYDSSIGDFQYTIYKLLIGQLLTLWHPPTYPVDKELVLHQSDYLGIYDLDNGKLIVEQYTKKGERIIFSDLEKTITYYKGKLITYDTLSWTIKDDFKVKKIKNKHTYYFELCVNKLFIYDECYKLLYTIDV